MKSIAKDEFLRRIEAHSLTMDRISNLNRSEPSTEDEDYFLELSDTLIEDVDIVDRRLDSVIFHKCTFRNVRFFDCRIIDGKVLNCKFDTCLMKNCFVLKSTIEKSVFELCGFIHSTLKRSDFRECIMKYADFTDCSLIASIFNNTDMRYAIFERTNLAYSRVRNIKMFNNKRYNITNVEGIAVLEPGIDMSPEGDGSIMMGIEALKSLQIETSEI